MYPIGKMNSSTNVDLIVNNRGDEVEKFFTMNKICATGLDRRMIAAIIELIESKVDPDSIVDLINELRTLKSSN